MCVRTDFAVRGGSALERQAFSKNLTLYQPFMRDSLAGLQAQRLSQGPTQAANCCWRQGRWLERPHLRHEAVRTECSCRAAAWDLARVSKRPAHASDAHADSPSLLLPADNACELSSTGADSPEMQRAAPSACARCARTGSVNSAADTDVAGDTATRRTRRREAHLRATLQQRATAPPQAPQHTRVRGCKRGTAHLRPRRAALRASHPAAQERMDRACIRRAQPERARPQGRQEGACAGAAPHVPAK